MADRHHQHHETIILDLRDNPVVRDTIASQALEIAGQSVAEAPRVIRTGDPFPQVSQNQTFSFRTEFA
jgi:hypothetical protein